MKVHCSEPPPVIPYMSRRVGGGLQLPLIGALVGGGGGGGGGEEGAVCFWPDTKCVRGFHRAGE